MDVNTIMHGCQWGAVIGASLTASLWDVKTGRIPNALTVSFAAAGLVGAACAVTGRTLGEAVAAGVLLAAPYVFLFALGKGGAGDAKLMGAIGIWLGLRQGLVVWLCVTALGGLMAAFRIALRRERWPLLQNLLATLYLCTVALVAGRGTWRPLGDRGNDSGFAESGPVTIPYGVAIFLGVCLAAVVVQVRGL